MDRPPPGGSLAQAVGQANGNLRDLYTCVRKAPKNLDAGKAVAQLRAQLAALASRDAAIRKLRPTPEYELVRSSVLRDRAEALVHGWATFSLLAGRASRAAGDGTIREALLALDRPAGEESPLALLLTLYSQIRAGEDNKPDPLRVRLADGAGFFNEFSYEQPWKKDEKPDSIKHDRYLPSTRDLAGSPDDSPEGQRDLLSVWALVNLQLDTWHGRDSQDARLDLARLAAWLRQLHDDKDLAAFDVGADANYGQALKERLDRLQKFVAFRDACGKDEVLHALVTELKTARYANKLAAVVELPNGPRMRDLIAACTPVNGESLPQAEIWLRYVLLLSYQGEGVEAVAGARGDVKGAEAFYKATDLTKPFIDTAPAPTGKETSSAFLRWGKWPAAGHFLRTVYDATSAAYRYAAWESRLPQIEKLRYASLNGPAELHVYAEALERLVDDGRGIESGCLAPYAAAADPADPYGFRPRLRPDAGTAAAATSSRAERERLTNDLQALTAQVGGAVRAQELTLITVRTDDPAAIAIAMQGLMGHAGASRWNVNALPTKTFADCARDVKAAAQRLEDDLKSFQYQQDLRERFAAQKGRTEALELELAATRLGLEVARQGKLIAETFEKIARLDVEIRQLEAQVLKLTADAATDKKKAADLRLTLANQARDLAAAQVEALQQATAQAEGMVAQASDSLRAMRGQLLDAAAKIEESKRRSGFFSIIKAVVNIVGVALAPFTGGASLAVAQVVNTAINIAEKVSSLDLSNVAGIAAGLADVANDVGTLADLSINKLGIGGEAGKKALADVKTWVKTAEGDVKRLSERAGVLLDGLRKLNQIRQSQLGQVASALASDIPISIQDGKLKIDFGKTGIRLKDAALEKIWGNILDGGGMVVNDVQGRARLAKLNLLPDGDDYQAELHKAVDELVRVCPEAMLLDRDAKAAARRVEEGKARLKAFIDGAGAEQRRFLGKLFDGWVVVKNDQGDVIAVERSVAKEAADFKQRVDAYRQQVLTGALEKLRDEIEKKNRDLQALAEKASGEQDPGKLRDIANKQVPPAIDELGDKLEALRQGLTKARGELKDAETNVEIAAADERAATALEEAARINVKVGELEVRKALLGETLAALKIRRAELEIEREGFRLQAAVRKAELAQAELRRVYAACRRWGVIPDQDAAEAVPRLSLDGILAPYDPQDPDRSIRGPLLLDRMAGDLVGMLQWVRLLNVTPRRTVDKDRYASERFAAVLALLHGTKTPREAAEEMRAMAVDLEDVFERELNIPEENLQVARAVAIDPKSVRWFDGAPAPETLGPGEPPKDGIFLELPEKLRPRALGYFRLRFTLDPKARAKEALAEGFVGQARASDPAASYYFFLKESSLVRERQLGVAGVPIDDLRYYFVPAANSPPNPGLPLSSAQDRTGNQGGEGKQVLDQLEEQQRLETIRDKLKFWQGIRLAPAVGEWTVFLLSSTDLTPAERREQIEDYRGKLVLTLRVPYLQVPAARTRTGTPR